MNDFDLENWLAGQDSGISGEIAFRATARVWPNLLRSTHRELGVQSARALLVASTWAAMDARSARSAAMAARIALIAMDAAGAAMDAAGAAMAATEVAARIAARASMDGATGAVAAKAAMDAARVAMEAAAGIAARDAVKSDCHIIDTEGLEALRKTPLWHNADNPLQNIWDAAQNDLRNDPDFHFWLRWYDRTLKGTPLNRDMLAEIALIPSEDWDQGPGHIAGEIARIELEYVRESTPMAERVEWVPDIQRIRITPVPMDNTALYDTVLDKLRDALSDIQPEGALRNAHAALRDILAKLDRTLGTHADHPQRVHDDMETALWSIRKLIAAKEIADDLPVLTLMRTLDENILDIEGAMPDVRATVQARLAQRFQKLSEEDRKVLTEATAAIRPLLEEERYQEDMREDAEALTDEDPNTEETKSRLYRLTSRLSRIVWIGKFGKFAGEVVKCVAVQKLIEHLPQLIEFISRLLGS